MADPDLGEMITKHVRFVFGAVVGEDPPHRDPEPAHDLAEIADELDRVGGGDGAR